MKNQSDLAALYDIISNEQNTFESVATNFQKVFPKQEQFKTGVSLWCLITENLLTLSQRMACFYILYDMYKNEAVFKTTPFVPLVLETIGKSNNKLEKKFLFAILQTGLKESSKQVISNYISDNEFNAEEISNQDLKKYWEMHDEECQNAIT